MGAGSLIKVMLVDDQRLFREGLEALIRGTNDIRVIGMADNGEDSIAMLENEIPDVVLMDIHMPGKDGIKTTVHIKELYPSISVVMLTSFADDELIIRGINVGADGFLLKDLNPDNLTRSIRDAANGQYVLSGEAARILVTYVRELTLDKEQILRKRLENRGISLTKRELTIANMLLSGDTNKTIAQELYLGEGTVKNYISSIYHKLNTKNRKGTVQYLRHILT
ncbi:response regulator transcription factor [Lentibacillus cibarius]|uniref:Response regulator transcription factor n=1 Tax=Lentibacillus cibarius TaxID=2583219 RepID=A0A5S3QIP0_9BACI|nr:response regulator transcription factor [Lentibacillus cibarius]